MPGCLLEMFYQKSYLIIEHIPQSLNFVYFMKSLTNSCKTKFIQSYHTNCWSSIFNTTWGDFSQRSFNLLYRNGPYFNYTRL